MFDWLTGLLMTDMFDDVHALAESVDNSDESPLTDEGAASGETETSDDSPADRGPDDVEATPVESEIDASLQSDEELETTDDDADVVETFTLPDGREITADQIVERFTEESKAVVDPEEIKKQVLAELQAQTQPEQSAPVAPDPFSNPRDWMRARWDHLVSQGQEPTVEGVQHDLQTVRSRVLYDNQQRLETQIQERREAEERQVAEQTRQQHLQQLTTPEKAPNLQGEAGKQLLEMALARAEKAGETDLAKVVKEANEFVAKFVQEGYVKPKQGKMRLLRNRMPRGGAAPAPVPKSDKMRYDGFESVQNAVRSALENE